MNVNIFQLLLKQDQDLIEASHHFPDLMSDEKKNAQG